MPTLIELPDIYHTIELCKELDLAFIELNMNMPEFCPENLTAALVRDLSGTENIEFTLHLPEEIDLASIHPAIRQGHLERCSQAITWASQAGIKLVNLHINSGIYFTLPDQKIWIYEKYQQQFISNLEESFAELLKTAGKSKVKICIENSSNFHFPFIADALEKLARFEGIYFTWDTGHDGKAGYREKAFLLEHESKIAHMHLHDYNGDSDHQILYSGEIDIDGMLAFAEDRNLNVVIEVKTVESLRRSIDLLKKNISLTYKDN